MEIQGYLDNKIFKTIGQIAKEQNLEVFVIGGWVRDIFLNRLSDDIDIAVHGSGIDLAKAFAAEFPNSKFSFFKNFGTAMVKLNLDHQEYQVEFVGTRKESYRKDSRKPIVENGTIEDDQNRRDFTINALALSLNPNSWGELLDPFNGIEHLNQKRIKTPLDPDLTFSDDPLRMIRAIRFACQLNFEIDPITRESIKKQAHRLEILSQERITDELNKIMMAPQPSIGFKLLEELGLLKYILPELLALKGVDYVQKMGHKDNFYHTLQVLDNICAYTENIWLRYAALFHDIAKAPTKRFEEGRGWTFHGHEFLGAKMIPKIFKRLRLSMHEPMRYVQKLVQLHLRPIALVDSIVTDSAVRRLLFDAGEDIDDLMTLCHADITSKNHRKVKKFHENFELVKIKLEEIEAKDKLRNWQPAISGEVIMETFGLKPSRPVGEIKNQLREAILEGVISNDFDEAYAYMVSIGQKMGLKVQNKTSED